MRHKFEKKYHSSKSTHDRKKEAIDRMKRTRGCERCGEMNLPTYCYDLHHIEGKHEDIKGVVGRNIKHLKMSDFLLELTKVQVLCAICHRIVTHGEEELG